MANKLRDLLTEEAQSHLDVSKWQSSFREELQANLSEDADDNLYYAVMPGDDVEQHPDYRPPNPWVRKAEWSFSKLKAMMENGEVPEEEMSSARRGLAILNEGVYTPPMPGPQELSKGEYAQTFSEDCDVYDPSGRTYSPKK